MKNFGISYTIFYFSCLLQINSLNPSEISASSTKPSIFLANLISQKFSHCSLLFLRDRYNDNDYSETLNYIAEKTNLNYYNVKFSSPLISEISLQNLSLNLSSIQKLPVQFGISLTNFNKKANRCKVILMMITDLEPEFLNQISTLLTPVFIPIVKKDTDYFVFMTKPKLMDKLLLMPDFPAKIKYKIAISDQESQVSNRDLVIKSVCFFCGERGSPEIIEYPHFGIVDYFPDFVQNLNGKILKISCSGVLSKIETFGPPWEGVMNAKRGNWKSLLEEFLMVKFNFTYNMFVSTGKDGRFGGGGTGIVLPNGTWIGVVGDVAAGKADIGIVSSATASRIHQVDFTTSFFEMSYLGFITSEGQRVYSPKALFWTFTRLMWLCIFITGIVGFLAFKFLIKESLKYCDPNSVNQRGIQFQANWGLQNEIFFFFRTYISRNTVMPRFQPLRCFVAFWLFFALILKSVYRSKLVGLLAVPVIEKLPETFEELANSDYKVGIIKRGDALFNSMKASKDPVYIILLENMEVFPGVGLECLERAVSGKYGCIAFDFEIVYLKARNLSDSDVRKLVLAPATTFNVVIGLITEAGSMYKENFNKWLAYTRSFHLPQIWQDRDFNDNVRLPKRAFWLESNQTDKLKKMDNEKRSNLKLKNIAGAFYLLFLGLFLGFIILVFDILRFYKHKVKLVR